VSTDDPFKTLVQDWVQPPLKQAGFTKKGGTFRRLGPDVLHLVVPQRSVKSKGGEVVFTVNLGVASLRLLRREEIEPGSCSWEECHWRERLGRLAGMENDFWWTIHDAASVPVAGAQVSKWLRTQGVSALDALRDDAALRDLWHSGRSPGLTEAARLLNLAVLLGQLGPAEEVSAAVGALKRATAVNPLPAAVTYLREIGQWP
jgi:hypothetical protein